MRHMKMYRFMSDIGAPVCKQDGRSVSRNIEGVNEGMSGGTGMNEIRWCAIGDSFTYLNDHLSETGYRVKSGYLDRTCEKVGGLRLMNHGINGSETKDWLTAKLPEADIYSVLLGTNDWRRGVPMGTDADFMEKIPGTILGNLGCLTARIRETAPKGRIVIMTPVERGDYVCLGDPGCQTMGSYRPQAGQRLCDIAEAIARSAEKAGLVWLIFTKMPVLQPRVWFDLKGCRRKPDITTMFIRVTWIFPTTGKEIRIHTLWKRWE